jgi:hypothetical protein
MKTQLTQTIIKCDACHREIMCPLNISSKPDAYFSFENIDLCTECSTNILKKAANQNVITEAQLKELIQQGDIYITARKEGYILC